MLPGYKFIRSDLIGNYWVFPAARVPVVTMTSPHIIGVGENTLLRQQIEAHQQEVLVSKQKLQQQQNKQQLSDQDLYQPTDFNILPFNSTQLTQHGFVPLSNNQLNQQSAFHTDNRALSLDNRHKGSILGSQMSQRTSSEHVCQKHESTCS